MNIQFVLVEPKVPENIGASARAIKTMGFNSLFLVNPCSWLEGKSKWVAHGSGEILEKALVFSSLKEAVSDSDFIVATSAKQRTVKQDYFPARMLYDFLNSKSGVAGTIALVFGREESGLTNDEMKLCDITTSIEMANPFPSLNLSQAVMIYAYELSDLKREAITGKQSGEENSFRSLRNKIREALTVLGLKENDNKYGRIMERISFLEGDDINLIHSLCNLLTDKINIK